MNKFKRIVVQIYAWMLARRWGLTAAARILVENFFTDYRNHCYPYLKIYRIHRLGFTVSDWGVIAMTKEKSPWYLSTAEYYAMHPLNKEFSKWIDDKLTLKYLCSGTELDPYLPEYYFQIDEDGNMLPLMDYKTRDSAIDSDIILNFLETKKILAAKRLVGSGGMGFYKMEYKEGKYYLNGQKKTREEVKKMVGDLRDYLITEFFYPHPELSKYYSNTADVLRYLLGRSPGEEHGTMLASTIQFGTKESGYTELSPTGLVSCFVDTKGYYHIGHSMDFVKNTDQPIQKHPDSQIKFQGRIPYWDEVVNVIRLFENHFPQLTYLGFDFVITNKDEVKLVEANSLPALISFERYHSVFERDAGNFYRCLLRQGTRRSQKKVERYEEMEKNGIHPFQKVKSDEV